jgi:predicted CXXCH cytochrome family protein
MTTRSPSKPFSFFLPALLAAVFAVGCTDTEIVYKDRDPFNPPADAASGFLGYYTPAEQQTTCGNCHADYQAAWKETAHAEAYETLHSNASAQDFCYACHTVNGNGNAGTNPIGYMKVQDSTYFDVQCESCHGQGLEHVQSVNQGQVIKPLARVSVGYRTKYENGVYTHEVTADTAASCASCHTGEHHPYVDQWAESRHAYARVGYANREGCGDRCHEGRGALKGWGAEEVWKEGPWSTTFDQNTTPITCAVCHDPHGSPNSGQLRFPINSTDETVNLCIKCHLNRAQPSPPSSVAPHGSQGAVLLGFAGYRPPNFVYDTARIYGSHASPTANPELCAGCHVQKQTINSSSGSFQLQSVGHLFKPIPCLDSQGNPTGEHECDYTATARSWNACAKSGCHNTATVSATVFNATRNEIETLVSILWKDVGGVACSGGTGPCLDPYPTDLGYLPKLKKAYPNLWTGPELSEAEGCEFNSRLTGGYDRAAHPDGSSGAHNPFLYRALISSCISYLAGKYPEVLPAPPAEVQAIIDRLNAPVAGSAPIIARVPQPRYNH